MSNFEIQFGALWPSLSEQLAEQGLEFRTAGDAEKYEKCRHSITYLAVHGLLSDAEKRKVSMRLGKAIGKAIEPIEPTKTEVEP